MKRIAPEEVLAAYLATGKLPVMGSWRANRDGTMCRKPGWDCDCCCPMAVLFLASPDPKPDNVFEWGSAQFGRAYFFSFTDGVDYSTRTVEEYCRENPAHRCVEGFLDGQAAWAAVRRELLGEVFA